MAKNWKDVKNAIEAELDVIFFDEPLEVTMAKNGIYPSGSGTDGQNLGNLVFAIADTQAMSWWTIEPAMLAAMDDEFFTLEHLKRVFKYMTLHMAALMGEVAPPNCPAPWMNMPKLYQFCKDILESYDSIKTLDEFRSLIWTWEGYCNCLNRWFFLVFPWELGKLMPVHTKESIANLAKLNSVFDN